jgi:hypothetical protein
LAKATGEHPAVQDWWAVFLKNTTLPNVELFNFLVPWGELFVGCGCSQYYVLKRSKNNFTIKIAQKVK